MAKRVTKANDERKARARYVDQPGQWKDVTPPALKKKQQKAMQDLMQSLTPEQRKAMGLDKKKKK